MLSSTALHAAFTGAWSAPAPLVYGTALGPAQLDATADVPGTFAYSPGAGTILDAGVHILSVTFTPSDSVDYTSVTATTTITVTKATPTVRVTADGGVYDGSPFDAAALVSGVDGASGSSLEGVDPVLAYDSGSTPIAGAPTEVGTYTVVASFPGSADYAGASSPPVTFAITPAPTTVALDSSAGSVVFGQPLTFSAAVTLGGPGAGTPTGTVTFLDGAATLGVVPLDASGRAVLSVGSLGPGSHSITAVYSGDADRAGSESGGISESVMPAGTRIVLVPQAVSKGRKVAALSLTTEVEPLAPGGGVPTGIVTFMLKKKTLGTAMLGDGRATLWPKPSRVLNKSITVIYGGAAGFLPGRVASPPLTTKSLEAAAQASSGGSMVRPSLGPLDVYRCEGCQAWHVGHRTA